MLAERRRADEAERDANDERRLRSLAPSAITACGSDSDDAVALRRKLKLATSEIEALRTHTNDLRNQIQSGWWSWRPVASEEVTDGEGNAPVRSGGVGEAGLLNGSGSGASDATAAAEAALLGEVAGAAAVVSAGGRRCADSGVSIELDRLTSLLAERDAQIGVLASTVEALQTSPVLARSSPRKSGAASCSAGARVVDGGHTGGTDASGPRPRASRDNAHHATSTAAVSPVTFWADVSGDMMEDGGGGVGVLNHVGVQGLARRCVALTVRLTSAIAREGKAERRTDLLAAEAARWERRIAAAVAVEADLTQRNRVLEGREKEAAAALNGLRRESAARLREAGEEASKLR